MSSKSSCPSDCGPRGDVIPTLQTEEEQEALSPKHLPHYSCFKSLNNKVEQEQAEHATGGLEKEEFEDASACDAMPQKESETESASCEWSVAEMRDEAQADEEKENIESPEKIKKDGDKKEKSDHSSSLFNIADAAKTTDDRNTIPFHGDRLEAPMPAPLNVNMLAAKNRATKSPPKSP